MKLYRIRRASRWYYSLNYKQDSEPFSLALLSASDTVVLHLYRYQLLVLARLRYNHSGYGPLCSEQEKLYGYKASRSFEFEELWWWITASLFLTKKYTSFVYKSFVNTQSKQLVHTQHGVYWNNSSNNIGLVHTKCSILECRCYIKRVSVKNYYKDL